MINSLYYAAFDSKLVGSMCSPLGVKKNYQKKELKKIIKKNESMMQ